jgi:hypothetical protein
LERPQPFIFVTDKKDQKSPTLETNKKDQKGAKITIKKGPEIIKKKASSVAGSPPSLDLDLYFSESPDESCSRAGRGEWSIVLWKKRKEKEKEKSKQQNTIKR